MASLLIRSAYLALPWFHFSCTEQVVREPLFPKYFLQFCSGTDDSLQSRCSWCGATRGSQPTMSSIDTIFSNILKYLAGLDHTKNWGNDSDNWGTSACKNAKLSLKPRRQVYSRANRSMCTTLMAPKILSFASRNRLSSLLNLLVRFWQPTNLCTPL